LPPIVEAFAELKRPAILDGEIVALGDHCQLVNRGKQRGPVYYVFDLLRLGDKDLRSEPPVTAKESPSETPPEEIQEGELSGEQGEAVVCDVVDVSEGVDQWMARIHNRMPVILQDHQIDSWVNPRVSDPQQLEELLKTPPQDFFGCYRYREKLAR
jgi:hypothetical protein